MVAPADGRVSQVTSALPPTDLEPRQRPLPRISIFMSVFDCHVNRSPVAGKIEKIVYHAGKFLNADLDKASVDNERNSPRHRDRRRAHRRRADRRVSSPGGLSASCAHGQSVGAGERIGMIRFGSRVDVYLPEGTPPLVAVGQTSIAGETVLADLARGDDAERTGRVDTAG